MFEDELPAGYTMPPKDVEEFIAKHELYKAANTWEAATYFVDNAPIPLNFRARRLAPRQVPSQDGERLAKPVLVAFELDASQWSTFTQLFRDKPICVLEHLSNSVAPSKTTGHAVVVYGQSINEKGPYWILRNSWGSDWGDSGTFRISKSYLSTLNPHFLDIVVIESTKEQMTASDAFPFEVTEVHPQVSSAMMREHHHKAAAAFEVAATADCLFGM